MKKLLVIMWAMVMLSGCMTFNQKMLPKIDIPKQENPAVIVETKTGDFVTTFYGASKRGDMSGRTVLDGVVKTMMNRWKNKGLIADFGPAGKFDKKSDFTLIVSGARDEEGSEFLAILCGATLGIIPALSKLTYEINVELVNNKIQQHYFVKVKNGVTMWMDIIFLPLFPIYSVGSDSAMVDMADYTYEKLKQQDAFKLE